MKKNSNQLTPILFYKFILKFYNENEINFLINKILLINQNEWFNELFILLYQKILISYLNIPIEFFLLHKNQNIEQCELNTELMPNYFNLKNFELKKLIIKIYENE
jgi:hypothetical protein